MPKRNPNSIRRHEVVDPNPVAIPVKFQRPPTLAEQIARFMGAQQRYAALQGEETPDEADDLEVDDDASPESPHELVHDPLLNREIPRYEKVLLDRDRAKFDRALQEKIVADRNARAAAERAAAALNTPQKKSRKKTESADADEGENE